MKKILLMDGHSILNRAFYGVPELTNSKGLHTNAVYGFLNILFKEMDEEKPDIITVAFDVKAPTFRHERYKEYKGTRKPMPAELHEQVPVIKEVLKSMNINVIERPGYEADDILGTIAGMAERAGFEVVIVSGDRDLLQLVTDKVTLRIPKTKGGRTVVEDYTPDKVKEVYSLTPAQIIDLKGLMGDSSDNIPGLPGVGEKTATKLLLQYGTVEEVLAHAEEITPNKARNAVMEHGELATLSKELATIKTDCELDYSLDECDINDMFNENAYILLKDLEFKSLLERFREGSKTSTDIQTGYDIISDINKIRERLDAMIEDCSRESDPVISFRMLNNHAVVWTWNKDKDALVTVAGIDNPFADNPFVSDVCGESPFDCDDENDDSDKITTAVESLGAAHDERLNNGLNRYMNTIRSYLNKINENYISLVMHNVKQNLYLINFDGLGADNSIFNHDYTENDDMRCDNALDRTDNLHDIGIMAYLLNPLKDSYDADDIARDYLGIQIQSYSERFGKKKPEQVIEENPEDMYEFAVTQNRVVWEAFPAVCEEIKKAGMEDLYRNIEMPLIFTLYNMENTGIKANKTALKEYGDSLVSRISELEELIYGYAGESFNINSPKQLGVILFEKMKLPYGKKTKTGYSTSADVLDKLRFEDPIVPAVLEYRQLTKLKSTYADGLAGYIAEDGRIHGHFNQTITATGRISSTEPNLQNIPIRIELGRQIRKVFVPREGCIFLDADYSQIELRVLAHMSGDESLIEAYNEGKDIHTITAAKVFHVEPGEVTPDLRRKAKAVNFGIVYGISSFGLGQDLGIGRKEAEEYIKRYFETYPGIKQFLDDLVKDAKETGYSYTMFGRRRPVPELKSGNFMQRSFGERVAMNAPIQGTAADIIKIAMINVEKKLKEEGLSTKMILQVHDELLLEVPLEEEEKAARILRDEMMNAADMKVKLLAEVARGNDWYEAK